MGQSLNDVLKKINKTRSAAEEIKMADESDLVKQVTSTGSPYIDLVCGGGHAKGGYNSIIADGGTGKSSLALLAIKKEQEATGRIGVYYDGEGTLEESYIDRMGVDRSKLLVVRGRNLENMLDDMEMYSKADDVGVMVIDSIPIFVSSVVEGKSAGENNMAVEARKFTSRMPIIEANCMSRNITLLGLTSYKLDPGSMGDPRKLPRGQWQYTMANLMLELTKKDIIKDEDGNPIGHELDIRIKKTKLSPYNPKDVFRTNFYYEGGFKKYDEFARIFCEVGVVKVGGAGWITYPTPDGEELKTQGSNNLAKILENDSNLFEFLKKIASEQQL